MGRRHADRLVEHDPAVHVALLAAALTTLLSRLQRRIGKRIRRAHDSSSSIFRFEIATDFRCSQYLLDPFRFVESLVGAKTNLRCEFQVNAMRDLAAQEFLVALERRDNLLLVLAAERHHVDGREPQVRAHAHFRHRDHVAFDDRIVDVAARQHLGERVANQFADAQRALRRAGGMFAVMMTGHNNFTRRHHPRRRLIQHIQFRNIVQWLLDARLRGHDHHDAGSA